MCNALFVKLVIYFCVNGVLGSIHLCSHFTDTFTQVDVLHFI